MTTVWVSNSPSSSRKFHSFHEHALHSISADNIIDADRTTLEGLGFEECITCKKWTLLSAREQRIVDALRAIPQENWCDDGSLLDSFELALAERGFKVTNIPGFHREQP